MHKTHYFRAIKGILSNLETAVKNHRTSMTQDVFNQIHKEKDLDFTANWNLKGAYVTDYIEK
jgi:hypothetical protein